MKVFNKNFNSLLSQFITEDVYGNTGWVYHRTSTNPETTTITSHGIDPGMTKVGRYGDGLYASYSLKDQLLSNDYGHYILKGKVNISNMLILEPDIYYKANPNGNFKKYLKDNKLSEKEIDDVLKNEAFQTAIHIWERYYTKKSGMIYKGSHLGINVVIWEKQAFIPYAYSDDNAKSWKKLNPDIKQIKSPNSVMNPKKAYSQAIRFRRSSRDVPNKMLEGIASKPTLAFKYIRDILNFTNIPDILLHSIARESYLAHEYAQVMNGSDIPDFILKSIASEGGVAFTYADRTLNWKNIPSLIHKAILDANYGKHIPKTATFMESFNELYTVLLEKYTKKKKKKVSKLRSKCQSKAKAKYDVWPSAYSSGYVQRCVKRKGKIN